MKDSRNSAEKLLDLPYAPEAEQYLDELERSGQFRVGLEALDEEPDASDAAAGNEYFWGRGSGSVTITDWWTSGRVCLRVGPGISPDEVMVARVNDSLVLRTQDGFDRAVIENYLGLIPDANTLRITFKNGSEWAGAGLLARITAWVATVEPDAKPVN